MKKVALVGLYSIPNMGDRILCETSNYLINEIDPSIEVVPVDVCPRYKSDYKGFDQVKLWVSRSMRNRAEKKYDYEYAGEDRYKFEYRLWSIRLNSYYKEVFKDVDAIIFAGGGFLKFRTQGLNYYVEMIVKIAKAKGIPVMFNGVGIEGYDENDIRCQALKKAINEDVVKVITTRDDVEILQNNYVENEKTLTSRVGDPAFWTPECYDVSRNESKVLGINLIRGKVFQDYGNQLSYDGLKEFYKELITEAQERGLEWQLFSNGMKGDQNFGREILREMGMPVAKHLARAPKTSEELLELVRNYDAIFGMRLHACITAYSIGVPLVGVIWNEKTRFFSQIIGKPESFFEEDEMDVSKTLDKLEAVRGDEYDVEIRNALKADTRSYLEKFIELI